MLPNAMTTAPELGAALALGLAAAAASLRLRRAPPDRLAGRLAWALAAAYAAVFVTWAVSRFYGLALRSADLGEYATLAYNTARGRVFTHTFRGALCYFDHPAPLLFVLTPFTYLFREPVYLVVIIALAAAASVRLVYDAATARGDRWAALALAAAYALTPALHGATLYENPLRALAAPLVLGAFALFARRRFWWGMALTFLAATASEEMAVHAIALAALGTVLCRRWAWGAAATAAIAVYAFGFCFCLYPRWAHWAGPTVSNLDAYVLRFRSQGLGSAFTPLGGTPTSTRLWYALGILGPVAPFLAFAPWALVTLASPLFVVATHDNASLCRLGYAFPFQLLPFVYGAAALGLGRLSGLRRPRLRRFLLVGGCVAAVAFPVILIAFPYQRWYRGAVRDATPDRHEIAVLAGIREVPPGVSVCADFSAFPFLAQRETPALFPHGLGLDRLAKVDGVFIDRDHHPAWGLASDAAMLRNAGYYPATITRDYAYLTRRRGKLTYEDLWREWYGVIREDDFWAKGTPSRPRRDDRAPYDGAALRFRGAGLLVAQDKYFFPPGRYDFSYILATDEGKFCHVITTVAYGTPGRWKELGRKYKCWTVVGDGRYHNYRVRVLIPEPAAVIVELAGTAPYYLDGVKVGGPRYNLAAAGRCVPWPYMAYRERAAGPDAGTSP